MTDARAKLYINTGVVTNKTDVYNILRPLLKQTVTYTYYRGNQVTSNGTGWVERIVVDHPEIASYFTPLSICLNLDSFDYLQFDTTSEQLLVYTLVIGSERVVLEFAFTAPDPKSIWLVLEHGDVSVCQQHPGFEVDVHLRGSTAEFSYLFNGRTSWREAVREGRIEVTGPSHLVRQLPTWFLWSPWHEVTRERMSRA